MRWRSKVAAAGVALAACVGLPSVAQATIEQGHPEIYVNGTFFPEKTMPQSAVLPGQIHFESPAVGSEGVECETLALGTLWNEGVPKSGVGQILAWHGEAHIPEGTHTKLSASCRPEAAGKPASFVTSEGFIASATNAAHEVEAALRRHSTPWNVEMHCGVREEEFVAILKIGVPDSEFAKSATPPHCPPNVEPVSQIAEEEEIAVEPELKKGCYATNPAPEGCIKVTAVEPGSAEELSWGGTLYVQVINGVHNGLTATRLKYAGAASGKLQCEFPVGCTASAFWTGIVRLAGLNFLELIQAK